MGGYKCTRSNWVCRSKRGRFARRKEKYGGFSREVARTKKRRVNTLRSRE